MCGIVGFINSRCELNLDLLGHRGPDNLGIYKNAGVKLGHARLSIQDTSDASNQPFISEDGRYVLVYNGEIYNHYELRLKLEAKGKIFKSSGDTETVLVSLIEWGKDALDQFNGIFALCLYDKDSGKILLARDRFGVKPLYMGLEGSSFAFASELKALVSWEYYNQEPDIIGLESYVRFLWSPGERTPLKNIKKILPGECIEFKVIADKIIDFQRNKFHYSNKVKELNMSEEDLIEALDIHIRQAIKRQLLSDVPIGYFLSGGLDSSLLVAIAKDVYPEKNIQCFTIDSQEFAKSEGFQNDLHYAKKVASYLNVDLEIVKADGNILNDFDRMIWHLDEPQADAAPLNVLKISNRAREMGFKVLIGGTAGDDLFSGYRRHSALKLLKRTNFIPSFIFQILKRSFRNISVSKSRNRRLRKLLNSLTEKGVKRIFSLYEWISWKESSSLFVNKPTDGLRFEFFNYLFKDLKFNKVTLENMLTIERKAFLVDHNLNYTDKMGMAEGIEIRVPYLDNDLVEFAARIPQKFKIRQGELKYILKKVAERYLPKEVIYRSKTGFGAPVRKWIDEDLKTRIKEDLSKESIEKYGIFNYDEVQRLLKRNQNNNADYSYSIWSLLAIQSWFKQFIKN